jgi:hypothetical protein
MNDARLTCKTYCVAPGTKTRPIEQQNVDVSTASKETWQTSQTHEATLPAMEEIAQIESPNKSSSETTCSTSPESKIIRRPARKLVRNKRRISSPDSAIPNNAQKETIRGRKKLKQMNSRMNKVVTANPLQKPYFFSKNAQKAPYFFSKIPKNCNAKAQLPPLVTQPTLLLLLQNFNNPGNTKTLFKTTTLATSSML